ncbi:hypothetical protein BT69DRAFT_191607 [Atractiella rhizophila]|nr:hypothetical protein BT69DRAFT_191607 [Atractiella rhizophila]
MSMNLSDAYPSASTAPHTHPNHPHTPHTPSQAQLSASSQPMLPTATPEIFFCAYASDNTGQHLLRHRTTRKRLVYIGGTVPENQVLRLTCPIHRCSKATWERIPLLRHHFRGKHHDLFDVLQETRHPPQLGLKDRDNNVFDFRAGEVFWQVKSGGKEDMYEIENEEEAREPLVWQNWTNEDMKGRDRLPADMMPKRKRPPSLIPGQVPQMVALKRKRFSTAAQESELAELRQRNEELAEQLKALEGERDGWERERTRLEDEVRVRDGTIRDLHRRLAGREDAVSPAPNPL